MHFKGSKKIFLNYDVFLSLNTVLILVNSVDPDEMQHCAAFHLGIHCLPKNPLHNRLIITLRYQNLFLTKLKEIMLRLFRSSKSIVHEIKFCDIAFNFFNTSNAFSQSLV